MLMKVNLKSRKSIIFLIISIVIVIALTLLLVHYFNNKKLNNELEKITINYYNNEFVETMPGLLKRNGMLKITLSSLKQLDKDVTLFEKNNCNLENTYIILTYNEKTNYDIETHLECK